MENEAQIYSDHYSVTLIAEIRIATILKIVLIAFYLLVLSFVIAIFSLFTGEGPKSFLLPAIGLGTLLFVSGRYVAWNLFGKETLTVTTKSISYFRDYGIFKIPQKAILFQLLETNTTIEKQENDKDYGVIRFFDRHETTMQLMPIFSSGINLPMEIIMDMEERIHDLFKSNHADGTFDPSRN